MNFPYLRFRSAADRLRAALDSRGFEVAGESSQHICFKRACRDGLWTIDLEPSEPEGAFTLSVASWSHGQVVRAVLVSVLNASINTSLVNWALYAVEVPK